MKQDIFRKTEAVLFEQDRRERELRLRDATLYNGLQAMSSTPKAPLTEHDLNAAAAGIWWCPACHMYVPAALATQHRECRA